MSPLKAATTTCELYDQALRYARDQKLPPDAPRPVPTSEWSAEHVALLERYREWLSSGGASEEVIKRIYLPMAGHALGLNLKPSAQWDLDKDVQKAFDYILAKRLGPDWTDVCRISLEKFRRFLWNERGRVRVGFHDYEPEQHAAGLPDWLVAELTRCQQLKQGNWRPARLEENIRRFWSSHLRIWRYLVEQRGVRELADLKRQYFYDYAEMRLASGHAVRGVNGDLRTLRAFLGFLQGQGYTVPQSLLRFQCLKEPDPLPKFLTDTQVGQLRDDCEGKVLRARDDREKRDALLDRATFYLLWQAGLRKGEVEELRLEDLDLPNRRLTVRRGKGMSDRTVFLTDTTACALKVYLTVRGMGPTDHVFLYRNQPLSKDLIYGRIKASGERVGVKVYPHRLRHTCATQLLNAGCRVTSIQQFLGHKRLNSTMLYARVHDQTVEDDYYAAMARVEQRLNLLGEKKAAETPISPTRRSELLRLAEQLSTPELSVDVRLDLVGQMRVLLSRTQSDLKSLVNRYEATQQGRPPPPPIV